MTRDRTPARHSIRWRLAAVMGFLIVAVVTVFLWATYGQMERNRAREAVQRGEAAADELAASLERSIRAAMNNTVELASLPAIRAFVRDPNEATRTAAIAGLPANAPGLRRLEVWDTAGSLILELATPSILPDTLDVLRSYPRGSAPSGAGVSPIRTSGEYNYFDLVAAVHDTTADGVVTLGYMRRFGQVSSSGLPIQRLLGNEALIYVGSAAGGAWTDFRTAWDTAPIEPSAGQSGSYRDRQGVRMIGGQVAIQGTPWVVWVGFPHVVIMAPAKVLMSRLIAIALLLVGAAVVIGSLLGARLTRPLRELAGAAEQIASGDYNHRVNATRRDEIGRVSASFNVMSDRIQTVYQTLRDNDEQTQFALAAAGIGVWESQLLTGRVRCSESMRAVLPVADAALPETRDAFLAHIHPEDRDTVREALEGSRGDGEAFHMSYRALSPTGAIVWLEGKARRKVDSSNRPVSVLGVSMDVTGRHRLEAQLRQAQKMEAIGQLAGGIAHDFNNLLTAIVGHASLVLPELPQDAAVRDDVMEILHASESAAALTTQLLTFSRHKLVAPQTLSVHDVITQTQKLIRRLISANIEIVTNLTASVDTVRIDASQLEQVIVNLAVNARDAMPDGGRLTIATSNVRVEEDRGLEGVGLPAGDYLLMAMSDTGAGMDAETQRRVFEPFFTTKPPGSGTGLGLATVFGITKQSGGDIYVYSEPGHGTTFKIYVPLSREKPAVALRAAPTNAAGGGETILIVEDNAAVRAVATTILHRAGYLVTVADSGEAALQMLASGEVKPDLIVTDVVMPGMSGPELYRQILARYSRIPVLFTSGYAGDSLQRHGISVEDTMFIEKPYSPQELTEKVREAINTA